MSDLVEQLRAQAVELREPVSAYIAGHVSGPQVDPQRRSLADLIDGMLGDIAEAQRFQTWAATWAELNPDDVMRAATRAAADASVETLQRGIERISVHVIAVLSGYTQTAQEAQ